MSLALLVLLCALTLSACSLWRALNPDPTPLATVDVIPSATPGDQAADPGALPTAMTPASSPSPTVNPGQSVAPTPLPSTPTATPAFYEGPITFGHSFDGLELQAYRLGSGPSVKAIIGGIHGGYEWNTVRFVEYALATLRENPDMIPEAVTLYVIPNMNPDGYAAGTDAVVARMNGNGVDLNRNWDYEWQPTATHGVREVSAGDAPFSEPETAATRDFLADHGVEAVIFYHSALSVVFSGADTERSATFELAEVLSAATGYRHQTEGIPGQITTGDAIDYLSTQGVAGAEVELSTHDDIGDAERQRNMDGIVAFLEWSLPAEVPAEIAATPVGDATDYITYAVEPGDTLSGIAEKYGLSVEDLLRLNDIADVDHIQAGEVLMIPRPADD